MPGPIPYITVRDANAAVDFYRRAFDAQEVERHAAPDGKRLLHAHLKLMGGTLYVSDDFPEFKGGPTAPAAGEAVKSFVIHLAIDRDIDAAFEKAVTAGATVRMPLADMFWGDRYGQLVDPFGFVWSMGMPLEK